MDSLAGISGLALFLVGIVCIFATLFIEHDKRQAGGYIIPFAVAWAIGNPWVNIFATGLMIYWFAPTIKYALQKSNKSKSSDFTTLDGDESGE